MVQMTAASVGGVGVGIGSTLGVKWQFDAPTETTVLRPSVLWGVGTGALAYTIPMFLGWNQTSAKREFVQDYGEGAFAAGLVSMFVPGGVTAPSV